MDNENIGLEVAQAALSKRPKTGCFDLYRLCQHQQLQSVLKYGCGLHSSQAGRSRRVDLPYDSTDGYEGSVEVKLEI